MIWASIGTSLVAGVFLLLGALQRRGQAPTAGDAATTSSADMMERVTAVSVKPREEAAAPAEEAAPAAAAGTGGQVSIVPGRPRYHVASCRFLAGRPDVEQVDVEQARSDGFTACGVCKPDAALAAAETAPEPEPEATEDTTAEDTLTAPDAPAAPAKKAPAKRTRTAAAAGSAGAATTAALDVPAADTAGDETAAPAKPAKKAAAKTAAAKPAAKAASSGAGA